MNGRYVGRRVETDTVSRMGAIFGGGAPAIAAPPPPPPLPPPAPTAVDQSVLDAGKQQRIRANQAGGLSGTNKTGPQGLTDPASTTKGELKSLLGS